MSDAYARGVCWVVCACVIAGAGCTGNIATGDDPTMPGGAAGVDEPAGAPGRPPGVAGPTVPGAPPAVPGAPPAVPPPATPAATACASGRDTLPPQRIWMLTPEQLPATVASLYGDGPKGPALEIVSEANRTYLGNDADLLKINAEQTRSLVSGTEAVAAFIAERIEQYAKCAIETPACFDSYVKDFATRAWRAPPADAHLAGLRAIYKIGAEVSPREGYRLALTAVLKSSRFLFRTELGARDATGVFRLTPWETAAQLSYFLLDAPPDAELRGLAASGAIAKPEVYAQQTERLLRDARAKSLGGRFLAQLTGADSIRGLQKDKPGALGFGDDVTAALLEEVRRFGDHVFFEGAGSIADLFTRKETFANATVGSFYGADVKAGSTFAKVTLGGNRTGVLSMPAVMAVHSQADHVVPTTRGRFVFDKLLCISVPNPPAFPDDLPAASPQLSPRQRLAVMKDFPACVGCHDMLDPVGFAFDNYDHVGRYVTTVKGAAVDPSGEIKGTKSTDGTFMNLRGLAERLAASEEVRRCVHRQFLEFAQGRALGPSESCAVGDSFRKLEAGGGKLAALVRAALEYDHLHVRGGSR